MRTQIAAAILTAALRAACGGGGGSSGGGGGDPGFVTLFADDFSSFPGTKWTTSGSGGAVHDPTMGFPAAGSAKLSANATTTPVASVFSANGGLQIFVRVYFPADLPEPTTQQTLDSYTLFEIQNAGGASNAVLRFQRGGGCGTSAIGSFQYQIGTSGTTYEQFNCASDPSGRFLDFSFIVFPDGTAAWQRDGNTVFHDTQSFGTGSIRLFLRGGEVFNDPDWSVWFDDVLVAKPN